MRLINASTLKLKSFIDDSQLPKYAILSHTWGAGEVTFDDLRRNRPSELEHMPGYQKIRLAALQTLRDNLNYVWVDTCCIDKTSSAELSESINSMFRWYAKAEICYAYLEDIQEEALAKARWFTRGWTLQELLAPDKLHFYDRGWKFIGDKIYLEPKIARITGIDIEALDSGNKLGDYSVATRMSWAASRTTTRAEDMAYCLMGIFDVNMPLLYGEGGLKAFTRLQQVVLEDTSDCSVFAWVSTEDHAQLRLNKTGHLLRNHNQGGGSIYAKTPKDFRESSGVRSSHSGEIIFTSIGVKLELPMFSLSHLTTHLTDSRDQDFFVVPDGNLLRRLDLENGDKEADAQAGEPRAYPDSITLDELLTSNRTAGG
ncbi:HET-domain-containing protein [Plenodomus tracheiphilus IPT5]|uniref:HET-domain-containing protein n=1 Tax=Plenodomus tracheiphilus IPT5 TaxID=1408161 RepID=A0A6A7AMI8_9PLEO|nr:HET-domain-containing protein [Plenodomus tracheiphilus IPT5]